jgi:hypothetical protein
LGERLLCSRIEFTVTDLRQSGRLLKGKFLDSCKHVNPRATLCTKQSISIVSLAEAKKIAFRRGIWYRALNRLERSTVDLTLKYVDKIKSTQLAKVLTAILNKLKQATESTIDRLARTLGASMAEKLSSVAVSWGYHSASKWATDPSFACYLVICAAKT